MKIFVTGGTGFIGSHFVKNAIEKGFSLNCLRRIGSKPSIEIKKKPRWIYGNYDIEDYNIFKGCDSLVHIASHSTNYPYDTLENCLMYNVTKPLEFLQKAKKSGIKNFIIIGSGFEYGMSGEKFKFIPTDAPLIPKMTYSVSKAVGSLVFSQWALENKLRLKYLRVFQVYGEGEGEERLWPSLKKAAESGADFKLTSGKQIRDFSHVNDIANKIIDELKLFNFNSGNTIFKNIGSGKVQSVKEFSESWWKKWNAKGRLIFGSKDYRDDEIMRFVPKITK